MMMNKFAGASPLKSFNIPTPSTISPPGSVTSHATKFTGVSMMAHYAMPLDSVTVVRLKDIKERMGARVDLYDDRQLFGLDMNEFKHRVMKRQPIDSKPGSKYHIGPLIKTSHDKKKRIFYFSVKRKASVKQIKSLLSYIQATIPAFRHLKFFIKNRKEYLQLTNVSSFDELYEFLLEVKKRKRLSEFKLTWL